MLGDSGLTSRGTETSHVGFRRCFLCIKRCLFILPFLSQWPDNVISYMRCILQGKKWYRAQKTSSDTERCWNQVGAPKRDYCKGFTYVLQIIVPARISKHCKHYVTYSHFKLITKRSRSELRTDACPHSQDQLRKHVTPRVRTGGIFMLEELPKRQN